MNESLVLTFHAAFLKSHLDLREGLLHDAPFWQSLKMLSSKFVVITDEEVAKLYGDQLQASFLKAGLEAILLSFPSGEYSKTREMKSYLEDQMLERGYGRDTCLIAFGGGVVLDLGGYIASTYCRGIPLVFIPTTLLAMVDASIGGKNGVNTPYGKNMVGVIYQPKKVLFDPNFLETLPSNELRNGFVEMIKHGAIVDQAHFDYLEQHVEKLLGFERPFIEKSIFDSCRIKKAIVEEDEKELGLRRILNFGHTVGHVLETLTHYTLSHGEAVAIGMLVESHLAVQLGYLDQRTLERIHCLLVRYGLPLKLPIELNAFQVMQAMIIDKKSIGKQPRFVILEDIGKVVSFGSEYCAPVETPILIKALNWMIDDLCRH